MFSQSVTLYLTPVFYTYMAAIQDWTQRQKKRKKIGVEAPVAVSFRHCAR